MFQSTDHHSVDDDDLHDAGWAEDPVINVPDAAVHQSSDHPAQPLFGLRYVAQSHFTNLESLRGLGAGDWEAQKVRLLPKQGGKQPERCRDHELKEMEKVSC